MITYELDIQRKDIIIPIRLKHGDAMSRFFKIVLKDGGANYVLPSDAELSLRFCVGGVGGWYSDIELPDGTTRNAVSASGNTFTCEIAEQATHGCGAICLEITGANGYQLSVWNIPINGEEVAGEDGEKASEYYSALIRYVDIAQESAESAQANAEAVAEVAEQVTPLISDVAELKTTTQNTARSLDALWKLNQGQTYDFETDSAESYSKQVVSGAHYASVESVGGKSVVWNQLLEPMDTTSDVSGVSKAAKGYKVSLTGTATATDLGTLSRVSFSLRSGHKILIKRSTIGEAWLQLRYSDDDAWSGVGSLFGSYRESTIITAESHKQYRIYVIVTNGKTYDENCDIGIVDLTQMFGSGNEPTSVDDPRIALIEQYASLHPEYNSGEIVDFNSTSVDVVGRNIRPLINGEDSSNGLTFSCDGRKAHIKGVTNGNRAHFFFFPYRASPLNVENFVLKQGQYSAVSTLKGTGHEKMRVLFGAYKESEPKTYYGNVFLYTGDTSLYKETVSVSENIIVSAYIDFPADIPSGTNIDVELEFMVVNGSEIPNEILPYHSTSIPTTTLVQKYFPNGMHSAGSVHDELDLENGVAIQRVGSVDLGTLIYSRNASPAGIWRIYSDNLMTKAKRAIANKTPANILCAVYVTTSADAGYLGKTGVSIGTDCRLFFHDDTFDTATAFKTAMNGVILRYELETPIITPITEDLTAFEGFSVESGGSIVFENDKAVSMPVPNSVEYIVKLSEVV